MQGTMLAAVLAVVAGAGGWWIGRESGRAGGTEVQTPAEVRVQELLEENRRLTQQLASRGPALEGTGDGMAPSAPEEPTPGSVLAVGAQGELHLEPLDAIDFAGAKTPDELIHQVLRWLHTKLGKGRQGHLEILEFLGELGTKQKQEELEPHFERLFHDDGPRVAKHLYPLIKYAVEHDTEAVALTETFFEQAANDPAWFADLDDDPFEAFTEGLGFMMPAVASDAQLDRFRAHAQKILDTPEDRQPEAIRKARRDIQQLLIAWSPPLSVEEAVAKLKRGDLRTEELIALMPLIPDEAWAQVDPLLVLQPLALQQDWSLFQVMQRLPALDGRQVERLDDAIVTAYAGTVEPQAWFLRQYVQATKRDTWKAAQPFLERAALQGAQAAEAVAQLAFQMRGDAAPSQEAVRWLIERTQLSEDTIRRLKSQFQLGD
ncbi:MAG: hypothetical protein AB7T63_02695 [Planctomycetota bacterium]